ncbi:MAG: prohibitin family protein [Prochlorococcus sp.]|jgi:regulator of protease activity HflC (stomatin/prohibitin superfamily)|nr:prohibitin family protein [Prochlorococcaceae cyanobacterium ETNP2_MAG_10]MDP6197004.1 prohibitin family protein [Prochlorococcaceae cyanobacterium ETNP18_MAG_17]MDP7327977.1 prohibitin family protein [Prochlorococcaceae cyanobacterium ETNP7_MAG_30]HJL68294.1 prohibitin family protein [Prochlorococcaceae cyanobacterium Gl_MAG_24]|tara:strand:+ start:333 stop:1136 length:804 start_codon:yes stop_codon:yes gene_type:complete
METPFRNVTPNSPGSAASLLIVLLFTSFILITQALFIVPAGQVAVVTTLGKVSGSSRLPGLNLKAPFIQAVYPFDVRTQVKPEKFASLTKDLQVIEATATVKYAVRPSEAGRVFSTIASNDREVYPRIIQPSLLKALKSVFSQYELVTIASKWSDISELVEQAVAEELDKFDYVEVRGLDLTGLQIAEEYRAAIEQKQIAEQQLLRAQTEVKIAEQEAQRYETLNRTLDDKVLFKLFLDKWDGQTQVVPALPGTLGGSTPVIVGGRH